MDIGQPMVLINKEDVKYIHGNQEINKESVQFMDNQWYCSRKKLYGTWTTHGIAQERKCMVYG